jgi:hypothetical protein
MLSYDDCVGLSELTPEEIAAIACRLHVPEIVAVGMGACLCWTPEGGQLIWRMSGRAVEEGRAHGAWAASTRWRAAGR